MTGLAEPESEPESSTYVTILLALVIDFYFLQARRARLGGRF
jgi:hypothetical protein